MRERGRTSLFSRAAHVSGQARRPTESALSASFSPHLTLFPVSHCIRACCLFLGPASFSVFFDGCAYGLLWPSLLFNNLLSLLFFFLLLYLAIFLRWKDQNYLKDPVPLQERACGYSYQKCAEVLRNRINDMDGMGKYNHEIRSILRRGSCPPGLSC